MAGKLKIVRVLANPIRTKKKKAKGLKRGAALRRSSQLRAMPAARGRYVIRVAGDNGVGWWNGTKFCGEKSKARIYKNPAALTAALKTAQKKAPGSWVVMDALPA